MFFIFGLFLGHGFGNVNVFRFFMLLDSALDRFMPDFLSGRYNPCITDIDFDFDFACHVTHGHLCLVLISAELGCRIPSRTMRL